MPCLGTQLLPRTAPAPHSCARPAACSCGLSRASAPPAAHPAQVLGALERRVFAAEVEVAYTYHAAEQARLARIAEEATWVR